VIPHYVALGLVAIPEYDRHTVGTPEGNGAVDSFFARWHAEGYRKSIDSCAAEVPRGNIVDPQDAGLPLVVLAH
jgi:hypothetical protein